ncbi:MAG TPA: Hsp20/alpha crystallin family protein [Actinomycetota bacterium]
MSMLERWDPFRDLASIQNELNRLFGRTFVGGEQLGSSAGATWAPPLDMFERNDKFVVAVELPGVEPGDVEVSVEDSTLTIKGHREFVYEDTTDESFQRIERHYGAFSRTLTLPSTADVENVEASFDKGVLTVEVPKREEAKPRKITVKAK